MLYSIELRSQIVGLATDVCLFGGVHLALRLLDAGLLTSETTEVEDACTTDLTDLVDFNLFNERGLIGENPFDADAVRNFADSKSLGVGGGTTNLDNYAAEVLKSVLVAFLDLVGHGDGVTCLELRIRSCLVL